MIVFIAVPIMSESLFGQLADGSDVKLIKLVNRCGMQVELLNYGCAIHRIKAPDKNNVLSDVTLYCTNFDDYYKQQASLGATIGRFSNRINNAQFVLDNQLIKLQPNEGLNQLHGGPSGFDKRLWGCRYGTTGDDAWAKFTLTSEDGDQGYPGTLHVEALYELDNQNTLKLTFKAWCDKTTVVNMTNHSYFNLSGKPFSDLSSHYLQIPTEQFLELDSNGVPTGKALDVSNTAMDFRQAREMSRSLNPLAAELELAHGYDHHYIFKDTDKLNLKARIFHAGSGRVLSILSNHPGAQLYTGNFLQNSHVIGQGGVYYRDHSGFCIEPQYFPDAPNHPHFPSCRLDPGETYQHAIEYQFSTMTSDDGIC